MLPFPDNYIVSLVRNLKQNLFYRLYNPSDVKNMLFQDISYLFVLHGINVKMGCVCMLL